MAKNSEWQSHAVTLLGDGVVLILPMLFADDIEAFWSNKETYRGRDAVVEALQAAVRELEADFESFDAKAKEVKVNCRGNLAWVACRIELSGVLTEERGEFSRTIRSTFVFEKRDGRWQMVHEHSSRLKQQTSQEAARRVPTAAPEPD